VVILMRRVRHPALAHGLAVYTANPSDFDGIDALTVVFVDVDRG